MRVPGFVKLYRQLKENKLMDNVYNRAVWTEILIDVDYTTGVAKISQTLYAAKFNIKQPRVNYILNVFKKQGMVSFSKIENYTEITVLNWDKFQDKSVIGFMTNQYETNNKPITNQYETNNGDSTQTTEIKDTYDDGFLKTNNKPITNQYETNDDSLSNQYILEVRSKNKEINIEEEPQNLSILKPLNKKVKAKKNVSELGFKFANAFVERLKPGTVSIKENDIYNYGVTFDILNINHGLTAQQIWFICDWARNDNFWRKNFLSPCKLITKDKDGILYYQKFLNIIESEKNANNEKLNYGDSRFIAGTNSRSVANFERELAEQDYSSYF
jgi:hypothetical protein